MCIMTGEADTTSMVRCVLALDKRKFITLHTYLHACLLKHCSVPQLLALKSLHFSNPFYLYSVHYPDQHTDTSNMQNK
jgi:hypothetical protein